MGSHHGRIVPAAELVRNFAHWREVGAREAVKVTHHGRETHIFMGIDHFEQIARDAVPFAQPDKVTELANRIHQGLILCRADLGITCINSVALAMTKRMGHHLEGLSLWDALPEFAGALTEAHIRHSLASGEASAADIPSPFRSEAWLHFETFPFADGVALLLRDISADVQRLRMADVQSTILQAMNVHGGIGYLRLSSRGFIEVANDRFCEAIGLPDARLINICLPDLMERSSRPKFRAELEAVLRGDGDRRVDMRLLTNDGTVQPMDASLARLHGPYGTEGAVVLATSKDKPDYGQAVVPAL